MTGQRARLTAAIGRAACLFAVVTALVCAPVAGATPESDADAAITAAWEATGGAAGPLGPPTGGVYPVGVGFGRDYARGRMFYTPDTGAHFIQGAILEKYESLGGPADSDLGFPTIDESPGRVGPDSRNVIFSAGDNPVIFWTPDTGAHVVRGAINAAWDRLGGSSGPLGVPAEDEVFRGNVVSQKFTGGELSWNRRTGEFTTVPPDLAAGLEGLEVSEDPVAAINAARRAAGGALGPLGARQGEPYPVGDDGLAQDFAGGAIYYSPATGANVLTGQVLEKYRSVGGPDGDLGLPTSGEQSVGAGPARMATFGADDEPVIFWTPDYGAVVVRGSIRAAWDKLDGAEGPLGVPVADQSEDGATVTQKFEHGSISYDRDKGRFSTEPADLAGQLTDLQVPAEQVPPPADASADGGDGATGVSAKWWWLVAVPLLVLIGALVGLTAWHRRRRGGEASGADAADEYRDAYRPDDYRDYGDRDYGEHEAGSAEAAADERPTDDDEADRFGRFYGEPSGPAPYTPAGGTDEPLPVSMWGFGEEPGGEEPGPVGQDAGQEDPDSVDTEPTRIPTAAELGGAEPGGRAPAGPEPSGGPGLLDAPVAESAVIEADVVEVEAVDEPAEADSRPRFGAPEFGTSGFGAPEFGEAAGEPHSGRHAAVDPDEPAPGHTGIHLPLADPRQAPAGFTVKASATEGVYWTPDCPGYAEAVAELWFVSEELAVTNGFVKAR